jgi:aryl-alcohol dehydrogenase-like predicted oxidoreductase
LNRNIEAENMLEVCEELGITVIAYSPLAQGLLTGKYSPENIPSGVRGRRYSRKYLTSIQPLIRILRNIGFKHDGKTPAQVALNWNICKGTVPIPGAKNAQQVLDNIGALGWRLTSDEVAVLDEAGELVQNG